MLQEDAIFGRGTIDWKLHSEAKETSSPGSVLYIHDVKEKKVALLGSTSQEEPRPQDEHVRLRLRVKVHFLIKINELSNTHYVGEANVLNSKYTLTPHKPNDNLIGTIINSFMNEKN